MTVLEVIQRSSEFLARKEVESPRLQVELLLAHVLSLPRLKLYLEFERVLEPAQVDAIRELVRRRGAREPLQHILGSTSFCGFEIQVNRSVLVPRPETELLAEQGWIFLQNLVRSGCSEPKVLDIGTGSGCLAVAVAAQCPGAHIDAFDISEAALDMARSNVARHQLQTRVHLFQGQNLGDLPTGSNYHLLLANPPYIPSHEIESLAPEVRDFDPRLALDGGPDGLDHYRRLAKEAPPFLKRGGRFMMEFGDHQGPAVRDLFVKQGWLGESLLKDDSGRERIFIARRID